VKRQTTVLVVLGAVVLVAAIKGHVISTQSLLILAVVVPSIILHEVSHGLVALWFGDDTAKRAGRLTLNPVPHIDPFGTIILPAILTLSGAGAFGYAKPVPVDVSRLRSPRNQGLVVSLAGPFTNLLLVAASVVWLRFVRRPSTLFSVINDPTRAAVVDRLVFYLGYVNVILATFNMLPLPPLDGSAIVERLLPRRWWPTWLQIRQYAMPGLLIIVLLLPGVLNRVFAPALRLWGRTLLG
jgi:Zn-dependent protease